MFGCRVCFPNDQKRRGEKKRKAKKKAKKKAMKVVTRRRLRICVELKSILRLIQETAHSGLKLDEIVAFIP